MPRVAVRAVLVCRVVETSSYAVDNDRDSDSSCDTQSGTPAGALTSQGSRAVSSSKATAKEFFLKSRTYKGMQTPATGSPLKAASLATAGMSGRAAVYSKESL
jgi:hypothetical protein